jgi:hypothetical protein
MGNLVFAVTNLASYATGTDIWYAVKYYTFSDYISEESDTLGGINLLSSDEKSNLVFGFGFWFMEMLFDPKKN